MTFARSGRALRLFESRALASSSVTKTPSYNFFVDLRCPGPISSLITQVHVSIPCKYILLGYYSRALI